MFSRVAQYLYNRPFWGDERYLIENLSQRDWAELLQPLDNVQAAPPGFLWLQKLSYEILGESTYALRLLPLIAGVAAVVLFWILIRRVSPRATLVGLALFASSNWLIYYSSETKQYALDVVLSLALLVLFTYRARPLALVLLGAVAVWFSHPMVFLLAGLGGAWVYRDGINRTVITAGVAWCLSFTLAYLLFYSNTSSDERLLHYWSTVEPAFITNITDIVRTFAVTTTMVSGFYNPALFFIVIAGLVFGIRRLPRYHLSMILFPLLLVVGAAVLQVYPYYGRFLLFLVPNLILLSSVGIQDVAAKFSFSRWPIYALMTGAVIYLSLGHMDVAQDGLFR